MIKYINSKNLTDEDFKKMFTIEKDRLTEDFKDIDSSYFNLDDIKLEEFYYCKHDNYTVILGDDWYLLYYSNEYLIEIERFYASSHTSPKRTAEIITEIRKLYKEHLGKLCYALLRHDTSYKLYQAYLKRGLIKFIKTNLPNISDTTEGNKLVMQLANGEKIDNNLYKCINHPIIFKIGTDNDILKPDIQEKQDLYLYSLKQSKNSF